MLMQNLTIKKGLLAGFITGFIIALINLGNLSFLFINIHKSKVIDMELYYLLSYLLPIAVCIILSGLFFLVGYFYNAKKEFIKANMLKLVILGYGIINLAVLLMHFKITWKS